MYACLLVFMLFRIIIELLVAIVEHNSSFPIADIAAIDLLVVVLQLAGPLQHRTLLQHCSHHLHLKHHFNVDVAIVIRHLHTLAFIATLAYWQLPVQISTV